MWIYICTLELWSNCKAYLCRAESEGILPLTPYRRTTKTEGKRRTTLSTRQLRGVPHHQHMHTTNRSHLRNCDDVFLSLLRIQLRKIFRTSLETML
ncbi:hypothetical protein QE152_g14105 [Popillia japonica]|uniref:Uncharacterized protein n=1 Tax=Popillia japonica TaxID=7064 RepID=A0AAW1LAK4_POPJA